ncbi:hypothetical protein [Niabella aquatica]
MCHYNPVRGFLVFLLLLLSISFFACTNPRYINSPSVHNAAFLRQQGDFKFSAAGAANPVAMLNKVDDASDNETLDHSYGFDGQAAVAVTNHFMLTASAMVRNEKDKYNEDDLSNADGNTLVSYKRSMIDIGAGFYSAMGAGKKAYFNGVAGVGFGKMSSADNAAPYNVERHRHYEANTVKYFFHPSFNFFFNDYLRMSVAPRFSLLKLNNIKTSYSEDEELKLGYYYARSKTFGLFEPAVLLQAGFKNNDWLKLDMGFNFSSDPFTSGTPDKYGNRNVDHYNVQSRNFLFSLGLSFYPQIKK